MKRLLKNATVVNVFTGELLKENVLIEKDIVIGVGDYTDSDADVVEDLSGKYICPGFIDGHIHIESTMLTPKELSKICILHGTTSIVADPHEIANVCGKEGIEYMLAASEGLPLTVYIMLPSCVPSTPHDESGAVLLKDDLLPFYKNERVLGLAEMMNYPGVLMGDSEVIAKINSAKEQGGVIDGHAPGLSKKDLDRYIAAGIQSDHECWMLDEAIEKLRKGQWIMIRQGTAAHNLKGLSGLFDSKYKHRCILVTDDRHPADIMRDGHIDNIIRMAAQMGKDVIDAIRMATIQAAECFGLGRVGAVAPGYKADILVLDDLFDIRVRDVYCSGEKVVSCGKIKEIAAPVIEKRLEDRVKDSFNLKQLSKEDFYIQPSSDRCRVIKLVKGQLVTEEWITDMDFKRCDGVDTDRDILKLAVIERHKRTGHIGLGFINGIGMKKGAIAASVSHDSHNLIVIGTNDEDMALAANHIRSIGGGSVVVADGEIISDMTLEIAGLMTDQSAEIIAKKNAEVREAVYSLGTPRDVEPFMNMAFVSLLVIPFVKMSTKGLVDVNSQQQISLYV